MGTSNAARALTARAVSAWSATYVSPVRRSSTAASGRARWKRASSVREPHVASSAPQRANNVPSTYPQDIRNETLVSFQRRPVVPIRPGSALAWRRSPRVHRLPAAGGVLPSRMADLARGVLTTTLVPPRCLLAMTSARQTRPQRSGCSTIPSETDDKKLSPVNAPATPLVPVRHTFGF